MMRGWCPRVALAALVLIVAACGGKTRAEIRFTTLPGEGTKTDDSGLRVEAPKTRGRVGGYVFAQAGLGADAQLVGPYSVKPGKPLSINDIPPGRYDRLVVYYLPELPASEGANALPVQAESDDAFREALAQRSVTEGLFRDGAAYALFGPIEFKHGERKILQATLVPVTSRVYPADVDASLPCPDTAGKVRREFVRLEPGAHTSVFLNCSLFDGKGITYVGTVSLYDAVGNRLDSMTIHKDVSDDTPFSALFPLQPGVTHYLYLEYEAVGGRILDLSYF